jgi:small ligand-binding sensory domain FIST
METPTFKAACATGADWRGIAERCMAELAGQPAAANFGFIYVTEALASDLDRLLAELRGRTGVRDWIGTVGGGICCTGREIYDEPAAAVMLAALPEDSYRLIPAGLDALAEMLTRNRDWIEARQARFGIVHGDPRNNHVPQIIESLALELDPGFLVGGLSSAGVGDHQIQIAGGRYQNGLSGALFSAEIPVISGLTQGCTPFGRKHAVTRCQRNILVELDGRPALEVFSEDIGEVLARDLSRVAGYIFAGLPVPGSDTGDYLVRNLIGIDPSKKLVAIGDLVEEGDPIMFCRRDGDTAREDMRRMLRDLHKRARNGIRAGVYYTCLGRGRYQFGEHSEELCMIQEELGDFPLVGFFANGEISHNRLYGYTGVLTLFLTG